MKYNKVPERWFKKVKRKVLKDGTIVYSEMESKNLK